MVIHVLYWKEANTSVILHWNQGITNE